MPSSPLMRPSPLLFSVLLALIALDASAGTISGHVRDRETGLPISGIAVFAASIDSFDSGFAESDATGHYVLQDLEPGTYRVYTYDFRSDPQYLNQLYDDNLCFFDCQTPAGIAIDVAASQQVSDIDFHLDRGGKISGTFTSQATGDPIYFDFSSAFVYDQDGQWVDSASTRIGGIYTTRPLPAGEYFVIARAEAHASELFDDLECTFDCDPTQGTPVPVEVGEVTPGIDFSLELLGWITGRVTDRETGEPLEGIRVHAASANGVQASDLTDASGTYWLLWLLPGEYRVSTDATADGYQDRLFDDIPCPPSGCGSLAGEGVEIEIATQREGVDFELLSTRPDVYGCSSSPTALCLEGGRFSAEIAFRDVDGSIRSGQPVRLTEDTGSFYFFGEENVEVVMKVLDACAPPYDRFWVFAAGLTNLELTLTVTDLVTGAVKIYENEGGPAFRPILDTDAFATCSAGDAAAGGDSAAGLQPDEKISTEKISPEKISTEKISPEKISPKKISPEKMNTVRLENQRFEVEVLWRTAEASGVATAVPLTSNTGYFWFFDADNVEVILKVLDACAPPYERYWVFSAGLTNVEATIRVTDTLTDQVREYRNPLGSPFQPILDTDAFDTCTGGISGPP